MTNIIVAIPIIRARLEVDVHTRSRLLPIDLLVMTGVHEGFTSPDRLADRFRLSSRLIDSAVLLLVEEDLLNINLQTSELSLTDRAQIAFKEGEVDRLAFRGDSWRETFLAMQELVWGEFVILDRLRRAVSFGMAPPDAICLKRNEFHDSILQISGSRVASLFNAHTFLTRKRGDPLAALDGRVISVPSTTNILLELSPTLHEGQVQWWPSEPSLLSAAPFSVRSLIARVRLWLDEHPDQYQQSGRSVVHRPSRAASVSFVPFSDPPALAEWRRLQGKVGDDQDEQSEAILAECQTFYRTRTRFKLVCDAAHVNLCRQMIQKSRDFCVVHSPFWSEAGIAQYEEAIREAVRRGVQVYLLRGLGDGDGDGPLKPPPVVNRLLSDTNSTSGGLHISEMPHHSHAKFVVSDGRCAIVSSFNFLGATVDNRQLNIGLLVLPGRDSDTCCAAMILRNLMTHAPPGALFDNLTRYIGQSEIETIDENAFAFSSTGPQAFISHLTSWLESLRNLHGTAGEAPSCAWETVTNQTHRDALLVALLTAERTIVVSSGDLTRSALDAVVQAYIRAAVNRGVKVTLHWGSQTRDPLEQQDADRLAQELQASLAATGRFSINLSPKPVHAKIIVVDGWVSIVSSYNFLSYRGLRSGAHELGIKIYSRWLSNEVESALARLAGAEPVDVDGAN